ncbi:Uncharacterised protein [Campylobacter hyointestinalis subsp. hyointestinalis]|uniref:Uncharacterized protein n=1 Tax=Campylobacter hyointestinalis subsp. hyointestinalis TaxID=91352 RepID=A0A9W5ES33_CAMHY|nr:hypothetical protein [Campylobacter hyointestinalis]CUU72912.1 Uncharacterised protein [Campylobacter hyointestinalis subsp. hyointestinalis]CUU72913.1 Uncharacterised protein [Campylobacter hyointestinalis subsp. hyointestinalis]CUU78897.1 Uncharacterised protein [Campylobacter hyointestinalis subsp. hyointestinalis]
MNFKRTTNSTENLDAFIGGADTQKEKKETNTSFINVKISIELGEKIKQKYPILSVSKFVEQALITDIPHIKEEILPFIYQQAKWHDMKMDDFVKFKMGLTESPQTIEPNKVEQKLKNRGLRINNESKEKITKKAQNIGLKILAYSEIKILATYELKDIFTFEELMQFKAEAMNYDLELDEYIAMRIKG